jgi:hypothetical protein
VHQPEASKVEEQQPKQKKSRFRLFGKKRTNEDRSKEEGEDEEGDKKEKYKLEKKWAGGEGEENERARLKEEEGQTSDEARNLQEDKDAKEQEEDKVVYLTDEDIEDLLK